MVHKRIKDQSNKIIDAILTERNLVRDGYLIVNKIGGTIYVSYDDLSSKELKALSEQKKLSEES
jgi:hypothetical protein